MTHYTTWPQTCPFLTGARFATLFCKSPHLVAFGFLNLWRTLLWLPSSPLEVKKCTPHFANVRWIAVCCETSHFDSGKVVSEITNKLVLKGHVEESLQTQTACCCLIDSWLDWCSLWDAYLKFYSVSKVVAEFVLFGSVTFIHVPYPSNIFAQFLAKITIFENLASLQFFTFCQSMSPSRIIRFFFQSSIHLCLEWIYCTLLSRKLLLNRKSPLEDRRSEREIFHAKRATFWCKTP